MEEKSVMQDQRTIPFTEFITKFISFTIRIPYIVYHGIKGLNMISGKKIYHGVFFLNKPQKNILIAWQ